MNVDSDFDVVININKKTLKGTLHFKVEGQYEIKEQGFIPEILSNCLVNLTEGTEFNIGNSFFRYLPGDTIEILWCYPKKNYKVSIFLKEADFVPKLYNLCLTFYEIYEGHTAFLETQEGFREKLATVKSDPDWEFCFAQHPTDNQDKMEEK
jgi:hypothetical protein